MPAGRERPAPARRRRAPRCLQTPRWIRAAPCQGPRLVLRFKSPPRIAARSMRTFRNTGARATINAGAALNLKFLNALAAAAAGDFKDAAPVPSLSPSSPQVARTFAEQRELC